MPLTCPACWRRNFTTLSGLTRHRQKCSKRVRPTNQLFTNSLQLDQSSDEEDKVASSIYNDDTNETQFQTEDKIFYNTAFPSFEDGFSHNQLVESLLSKDQDSDSTQPLFSIPSRPGPSTASTVINTTTFYEKTGKQAGSKVDPPSQPDGSYTGNSDSDSESGRFHSSNTYILFILIYYHLEYNSSDNKLSYSKSELAFARWVVKERIGRGQIDRLFKNKDIALEFLNTQGWKSKSYHSLKKLVRLVDGNRIDWICTEIEIPAPSGRTHVPVYHQSIVSVIKFLISHKPFKEDLVYAPVKEYKGNMDRVYSEAYTADVWWDLQEKLPDGATVIPIQWFSDKTHLTQFRGDHGVHPCYVTILNLSREARRQASRPSLLPLGLIPIIPKDTPHYSSVRRRVFHEAMRIMFRGKYSYYTLFRMS